MTLALTLAPCEVRRWTQAARNALPLLLDQHICLLHNFHVGTELHARDGQSHCMSTDGDRASQSTQHTNPHYLTLAWYDSGDTDTDLASHVRQIRAGEGKSIILKAGSTLFALLGFRISTYAIRTLWPQGLQPLRVPLQGLWQREARRLQHKSADHRQLPPACT